MKMGENNKIAPQNRFARLCTLASRGWAGGTFSAVVLLCVSFLFWREIGFGFTYWVTAKIWLNFRHRKFRIFLAAI
jgi:hypothetical protein